MSLQTFVEAVEKYSAAVARQNSRVKGDAKMPPKLSPSGNTAYTDRAGRITHRKDMRSGLVRPLNTKQRKKAARDRRSRIRRGVQKREQERDG